MSVTGEAEAWEAIAVGVDDLTVVVGDVPLKTKKSMKMAIVAGEAADLGADALTDLTVTAVGAVPSKIKLPKSNGTDVTGATTGLLAITGTETGTTGTDTGTTGAVGAVGIKCTIRFPSSPRPHPTFFSKTICSPCSLISASMNKNELEIQKIVAEFVAL